VTIPLHWNTSGSCSSFTQSGRDIPLSALADEYGGGLTLDRPGMGKVTQAVLADEVDVVLVHSLTRIGREWGMTQSYIDQLTRHKVKLLCIKERCLFSEKGVIHF